MVGAVGKCGMRSAFNMKSPPAVCPLPFVSYLIQDKGRL